jgi:Tfp pilus assembly PilM family ATPase
MGRVKQRSTTMSNKSNSAVATIGIDIGKNAFHVVGLDRRGATLLDCHVIIASAMVSKILGEPKTVIELLKEWPSKPQIVYAMVDFPDSSHIAFLKKLASLKSF